MRTLALRILLSAAVFAGCVGGQTGPPGSPSSISTPTATPTVTSTVNATPYRTWKLEAATRYLAAASELNEAWETWVTDSQAISEEALATGGTNEEQGRAFLSAWLPCNHALGEDFRTFAGAVRALPIPPSEGQESAAALAEKADWLADYLSMYSDADAFLQGMGTVDSWGVHWLDATGYLQTAANQLRALLGLSDNEIGV